MRKLLLVLLASFMITLPNIGMAQSSGSSSSGSSSSSSSSSSSDSDSESEGESANATGGTPTAAPEAVVAPCADTGCDGGDGADKSDNASNGVGSTLGDAQAGNANFTGYNNTPTYDYDVSYGTVTGSSYTVNPSFSNDETESGNLNNSYNPNATPSDSSSMFGFDGPPDGLGSNQPDRYANDYEPKPPNADFTGGADPLTPLNIQITDANKNDVFAGANWVKDGFGGLKASIDGREYNATPAESGNGYTISQPTLLTQTLSLPTGICATCLSDSNVGTAISHVVANNVSIINTAAAAALTYVNAIGNRSLDVNFDAAGFRVIGGALSADATFETDKFGLPSVDVKKFSAVIGVGRGFVGDSKNIGDASASYAKDYVITGRAQEANTVAVFATAVVDGNVGAFNGKVSATTGIQSNTRANNSGMGNAETFGNVTAQGGVGTTTKKGAASYAGFGFSYVGGK